MRNSRVVKSIETVAESCILTFSGTTIKKEHKAKIVEKVAISRKKEKKTKAPNIIFVVNRKENILKTSIKQGNGSSAKIILKKS